MKTLTVDEKNVLSKILSAVNRAIVKDEFDRIYRDDYENFIISLEFEEYASFKSLLKKIN